MDARPYLYVQRRTCGRVACGGGGSTPPHRRRRGGSVDLGGAGGQIRRGNKQGADRVSGARGTRPRARCPPVAPARPPRAGTASRGGVGAAAARHGTASARLPGDVPRGVGAGGGFAERAGGSVVALAHARGGSGEHAHARCGWYDS